MPTKQGGRALKNASTSDRCSFRRNTALPAASTPCSWKTRLAMVQTDCGNLHGGRLLQLVALNGPSLAHRCRQGSSTASDFNHLVLAIRRGASASDVAGRRVELSPLREETRAWHKVHL